MAIGRLSERARASQAIWPGFVDAMTALLLVLMFVLSIFMIVQFVLRATITGQESRIEEQENQLEGLSNQLAQLSNVLAMEQTRADDLEDDLGVARATLADRDAEINQLGALVSALTNDKSALETRVASFEAQVASLLARQSTLEADVAALQGDVATLEGEKAAEIDAKEALQLALARARDELDAELEAARLAAAQREAMEALIASLEADKTAGEEEISGLKAAEAANLALIAALESDQDNALERIAALAAAQELDAETIAELQAGRTADAADIAALKAALDAGAVDLAALESTLAARAAEIAVLQAAQAEDADALAALETARDDEAAKVAALEAARDAYLKKIAGLEEALSDEERLKLAELAAAKALRERLKNADAELTAMTLALEERRREAEETLTLLAAAEAARADLTAEREALLAGIRDETTAREREEALLALARERLAEEEATVSEQAKNLALLNEQAVELRSQLAELSAQLDASEAADREAQVEIVNLGQRLNAALARELQLKAKEAERLRAEQESLEAYRSEFFGEMRKALGERRDIRIVGDRFIFQSEVLFSSGSAELDPAGRAELAELGEALRDVISRIPDSIDWLLVVEGHTDNIPLVGSGRYRDNWELSQGRALSVVQFLADGQDIPSERLAALGYGEYQPVDTAATSAARARNRRIELKFTERPPRVGAE